MKFYKDLLPARHAALQREQTEKTYKRQFFDNLRKLAMQTDPLSHFALTEGNEDTTQTNVLNFVSQFLIMFSEMEKNFVAEGKIFLWN